MRNDRFAIVYMFAYNLSNFDTFREVRGHLIEANSEISDLLMI